MEKSWKADGRVRQQKAAKKAAEFDIDDAVETAWDGLFEDCTAGGHKPEPPYIFPDSREDMPPCQWCPAHLEEQVDHCSTCEHDTPF